MTRLRAEGLVSCEPAAVYAFLADLSNHRRLGDRHFRLTGLDLENGRACIVVHGPLGVRRTARMAVTRRRPPRRWGGTATVGRRTRAAVIWQIEPHPSGSLVVLSAHVVRAEVLDRALLAFGGRAWLHRRFAATLASLAAALDGHPLGAAHHHAVRAAHATATAHA